MSKFILCCITLVVLCCYTTIAAAQKTIYIPLAFNRVGDADYCNKNGTNGTIQSADDLKDNAERWSKVRSYETDNFICFWEAGFGTNPDKMLNPTTGGASFSVKTILTEAEKILAYHRDTLNTPYRNGANYTKYKILVMLSYSTATVAYGSGYDYQAGAVWVNPVALGIGTSTNKYFVFSHELYHAVSYLCYCDRPDNTYRAYQDSYNGPFWERSAQHAASTISPQYSLYFDNYMYATHSHYLSTRKHYSPSLFLDNLDATFGKSSLGRLWENNTTGEHVMNTAAKVFFGGSQSALNDFIGQTAMKNITWDYPATSNGAYFKTYQQGIVYSTDAIQTNLPNLIMKKFRTILYAVDYDKRHFAIRDAQAPQDYGYNAIQLYPEKRNTDGSATINMHFKGHTEDASKNPGWRYGFVAIQNNGTPRYGTLYSDDDKLVSFNILPTDTAVWLIVTGAPKVHNAMHNYSWEAGFPKYCRYPYEVRFENALPMGYNTDYEGELTDGAPHPNGGGWVSSNSTVAASAYVGPHAKVLGASTVSDNARIEDFAIVKGKSKIYGNAVLKENAMIFGYSSVYGNAIVSGSARCTNQSIICDTAFVTDNALLSYTKVSGHGVAFGSLWQKNPGNIGGTAVIGGDAEEMGKTANGGTETKGTYIQYPDAGNNGRSYLDGKGNLSTQKIDTLRANWNNLALRYRILNNSISSIKSNINYDINLPYSYFNTDKDLYLTDPNTGTAMIAQTHIEIYPNPATDLIQIDTHFSGGYKLSLFNLKGEKIYTVQQKCAQMSISLAGYPPGVYIIKTEADNYSLYNKIIKL